MERHANSCRVSPSSLVLVTIVALCATGCRLAEEPPASEVGAAQSAVAPAPLRPVLVTEPVTGDSDDPAIWLHPEEPSKSLIIGTDKGGALFVFDLEGKIIPDKTVAGLARMNNVDVEYGMMLGGIPTDIAVATEREANSLRAFRLPDMTPIDNGGIPVFEGQPDDLRRPMGIALYKRPTDGAVFAIVSRKTGPAAGYLWQYRLEDDGTGDLSATKVREFGSYSGSGEIEAIAVDDPLGYVYYSDEWGGVKKYLADPDAPGADQELAVFGTTGFTEDREGISIYQLTDGTGYILVSDQQANTFRIFPREGEPGNPHGHPEIKTVLVSTNESDGSDVTSAALGPAFPSGLFVAMSDNKTFHFYSWEDIAGDDLKKAGQGDVPQSEGGPPGRE